MNFTAHPATLRRKITLWGILILIVVVVTLGSLEAGARLVGFRTADDPYIHFGRVASIFDRIEIDGAPNLQVSRYDVYRNRKTTFAVNKAPDTFRIFCVGGSASAGWPHPRDEIYSAYLQSALQRAYPDRTIEIINVSAHAYAAYRVRLIVDEIVEYDPDLVIVYSGNNEFIEKRSYAAPNRWRQSLVWLANRSVAWRLVRGSFVGKALWPENTISDRGRVHVAFEHWSKIEQLPLVLHQDPVQFQFVQQHYEASIRSMLDAAAARSVPVLLLTVPVNLREWYPNVSVNTVDGHVLAEFDEYLQAGRVALFRGDDADAAFRRALAIDPAHAGVHFELARALEATGDWEEAAHSFEAARDLDANPFRTHSSFNAILHRVSAELQHVDLIDADRAFRDATAPALPGFKHFLDYVHPSRQGNLLIAELIFDHIVQKGYVGPAPSVARFEHIPDEFGADGAPYDEKHDYDMQRALMMLYAMMHQDERVAETARFLVETPGALDLLGEKKSRAVTAAYEVFTELQRLRRLNLLGETVTAAELEKSRESLNTFYHDTFKNYREFAQEVAQTVNTTQ